MYQRVEPPPTTPENFELPFEGKLIESDPDGDGILTSPVTEFVYEEAGNLIETIDAKWFSTLNAYDSLNRLILTTDADNNTTGYSYDSAGNLVKVTKVRKVIVTAHRSAHSLIENEEPARSPPFVGWVKRRLTL